MLYVWAIWILEFLLLAEGTLLEYDMGTSCGQTLTLSETSGTSGVDVLMYMTVSVVPRMACTLTFDTTGNTHFYLTTIDLGDCTESSLNISRGETLTSTTLLSGFSSVCGPGAGLLANKHHVTADRFLVLSLAWNNATRVNRTVFRFIINVYTCDSDCPKENECDNGWCLNSNLTREKNFDFCPDSLECPEQEDDEDESKNVLNKLGFLALFLIVLWICGNCIRQHVIKARGKCGVKECLGETKKCFLGVINAFCSCVRNSAINVKADLTGCFRRARESLDDCICKRGDQSSVSPTPASAPRTTDTSTNTEALPYVSHIQLEVTENEEQEGAPPSYSAAMRMPEFPVAPPSYESALDMPPAYTSVMANQTFYGAEK